MRGIIYLVKQKYKTYNEPLYIGSIECDMECNRECGIINKIISYHKNNCEKCNIFNITNDKNNDKIEIIQIGVIEYSCKSELKKAENIWRDAILV